MVGAWAPPQKESGCKALCHSTWVRNQQDQLVLHQDRWSRQMTAAFPGHPLYLQDSGSYSWGILVASKVCCSTNLFMLVNKHKNFSFNTLKRAFHGYTITEKSSKWPLLFPHHSAFLFLPFCFHSETIHACTKVFSMLEKYKIKFCLLVHQTSNHNNLCLCDILIMICISIMGMRIQFCVSAPRDTGALLGRFQSHSSCRAQNGIEAGNVGMTQTLLLFWSWTSAVLPKRFFNNHAWETEQNWRGSSVPLFILSFSPENLCLFLRNYFRLGISEIHFCCTLPAKIT